MHDSYLAFATADFDAAFAVNEALRRAGLAPVLSADRDAPAPDAAASWRAKAAEIADSHCVLMLLSAHSEGPGLMAAELATAQAHGIPVLGVRLAAPGTPGGVATDVAAVAGLGGVIDASQGIESALPTIVSAVRRLRDRRCPVISVMNLKGGVGKTTVTAQVFGAAQKARGNRVLLIDLDPQANLSQYFLTTAQSDTAAAADQSLISMFEPGLCHDLATGRPAVSPADVWDRVSAERFTPLDPARLRAELLPTDGTRGKFDLIPGQFEVSKYAFLSAADGIERAAANFVASLNRFRRAYDLIVIDTNPSASLLTRCALAGANLVLAPMRCDPFSLRGVRLLHRLIERWAPEATPPLRVLCNATHRTEPDAFERDLRAGVLDGEAGWALSQALFRSALPQSKYLEIKPETAITAPLERLAAYGAKGLWARDIRARLDTVAMEVLDAVGIDAD
jgi:cellulose biosynthesis protein BcsQ